jgi:hypothetical protein
MSLSQKIAAELASRAASGAPGPAVLAADEPPHRMDIAARQVSMIGAEIDVLDFWADRPAQPDRTISELQQWADRLAATITYLMEPLVVIEIDAQGVEVEMRSQAPTVRQGLKAYYEARLDRSGHLRITRRGFDQATRMTADVPFQLTGEVLERLADDLVATAG